MQLAVVLHVFSWVSWAFSLSMHSEAGGGRGFCPRLVQVRGQDELSLRTRPLTLCPCTVQIYFCLLVYPPPLPCCISSSCVLLCSFPCYPSLLCVPFCFLLGMLCLPSIPQVDRRGITSLLGSGVGVVWELGRGGVGVG
ncbi:hypothetical protein BU14_0315s0002 [Porphyra umbilicalis]|uniref:Secreted protein n=1 Tax=Porphyra umbilicalis TaxID=2786 RepID=A0A1X6NZG5_PORUM|nr:hypothetical protein BU14_0315s0002 [Porphyra umbilicalis]|eukprot:OSX73992.1 hypothetical protein BU14_0315s0002 [Porphyra umbilicalis]